MRALLGGIGAACALPIARLLASNTNEGLSLLRLTVWWVGLVAIFSVTALFIIRRPGLARDRVVGVTTATALIVLFYAVAISDSLGLESPLGVDGSLWIATGLLSGAILATRWQVVSRALPVVAVVLTGAAISEAAWNWLNETGAEAVISDGSRYETPASTPNIYWFVLDGYARADVLASLGAPEPGELSEGLSGLGFQVADMATSPYSATYLSLSSTLLMDYVATDPGRVPLGGELYPVLRAGGHAVRQLKSWGYSYLLFPAWNWQGTECSGAEDVCLAPARLSPGDRALLSMTVFDRILPIDRLVARLPPSDLVDPRTVVEEIESRASTPPFFVFAHILNPHPPFHRYKRGCRVEAPHDSPHGMWGSPSEYVQAVACLNRQVLDSVARLVAVDPSAIIVIQSDHGPTIGWDIDSTIDWSDEQTRMKLGVLLGARLPMGCHLPEDLNTVNVFRVLLGCMSGDEPMLLTSRHWQFTWVPRRIAETEFPAG